METIKRVNKNVNEMIFNFADRYPGLLSLLLTVVIFTGVIRQ
jgi:hypothetical protein